MASNLPKRHEALGQWSRAPVPADLASPTGARHERFVHAVADAMQRPLTVRDRGGLKSHRGRLRSKRFAVAACAAALLMTVGVVFARSGGAPLSERISALFHRTPSIAPPRSANGDLRTAAPPLFAPVPPSSSSSLGGNDVGGSYGLPPPSHAGRGAGRTSGSATPTDSDLGTQNRLFASAMNTRERRDYAGALRILDELIRRYPASGLAQDAHVERFRTLQQMGDTEGAARAARRYLALYPSGFAREEARALALDPTP